MKNAFVWVCIVAVGVLAVTAVLTNHRYTYINARPVVDKWTGRNIVSNPPALAPMVDTGLWVLGSLGIGGILYVLMGAAKKKVG